MYQIKLFTASTPSEVEERVNEWLKRRSGENSFRLVQVTPTDVVQVSSTSGIQRFTLVLMYEMLTPSKDGDV